MGHERAKLQFYTGKNLARGAGFPAETRLAAASWRSPTRRGKPRLYTNGIRNSETFWRISGEKEFVLADSVLQSRRQLVHVPGGKVHHFRVKHRDAVAAYGIPPHLNQ